MNFEVGKTYKDIRFDDKVKCVYVSPESSHSRLVVVIHDNGRSRPIYEEFWKCYIEVKDDEIYSNHLVYYFNELTKQVVVAYKNVDSMFHDNTNFVKLKETVATYNKTSGRFDIKEL